MEDLKEKLLCALKKNILELRKYSGNWYLFSSGDIEIFLGVQYKYENKIEKIIDKLPFYYFWKKDKNIIVTKEHSELCSVYNIFYNDAEFKITKEECEEILKLRKEAIEQEKLKQLDNLCK